MWVDNWVAGNQVVTITGLYYRLYRIFAFRLLEFPFAHVTATIFIVLLLDTLAREELASSEQPKWMDKCMDSI